MPNLLERLPPEAVLTDRQVCELLGISQDTLLRLERQGDAPRRVRLSPRRHGRQLADVRRWIAERTAEHDSKSAA
jgi:predicted DNA-binding transcriptional regulator AlpA